MFGKLIKYEWKAMIRAMLPVYGATVAISLINGIALNSDLFKEIQGLGLIGDYSNILYSLAEFIQFLLAVLYVVMFVGLFVMTLIVTVRRFWNGLLKEEGYLMFTLPVKTSSLALSKAVVSFFIILIHRVQRKFHGRFLVRPQPFPFFRPRLLGMGKKNQLILRL